MSAVKDAMTKTIQKQSEASNFEEILRALLFVEIVNRGLADSDAGRIVYHEEMARRIRSWQK